MKKGNNMKDRYFSEVIQTNDDIIKFQMVSANFLGEALEILASKYSDIKEWRIKDMVTGISYTSKDQT